MTAGPPHPHADPAASSPAPPAPTPPAPALPAPAPPAPAVLPRQLTVRAACPECALPVRVTLLAVIDPHASELQPIVRPRLTALGLLAFALGPLITAAVGWAFRVREIIAFTSDAPASPAHAWPWGAPLAAAGLGLSALGALALIRPHAHIGRRQALAAALATLAYIPLAFAAWMIHAQHENRPYFGEPDSPAREALRLVLAAAAACVILGFRPNVRTLVARSVLMRSGRVDRQTFSALASAVLVAAVGDALRLCSHSAAAADLIPDAATDILRSIGAFVVAAGSLLLTVGLIGFFADALRLRRAILFPPVSVEHLVGSPSAAPPAPTPLPGPAPRTQPLNPPA